MTREAPAPAESCARCRFYRGGNTRAADLPGAAGGYVNPNGDCRRFPTPVKRPPTEWCGEFQAKENAR